MERIAFSSNFPGAPGAFCGTTHGTPRMQGARRATGTRPPPRGGWRGHEWKADAWQKTSGRGRDGGSTALGRRGKHDLPPPTKETIPLRMAPTEACIDGHPQYSPAALSFRSAIAVHKPSSFGRHPPLGGGRMLAHSPFSKYRATISRQSSPSTIIPEEPASRTFPQHMVVRKRDHAPAALRDIPAGARRICDFGCNSPRVGAFVPAGEKEQTPIRPMPALTLRRCVSNASSSCSNVRKDGCPGGGASVLAHALKIFSIRGNQALGQLRTRFRECPGIKMGKMSTVRAAKEATDTGHPPLPALLGDHGTSHWEASPER